MHATVSHVRGVGQSPEVTHATHELPLHTGVGAEHAAPHIPQFAASLVVSTHIDEQHVPLAQPIVQAVVLDGGSQYSQGDPDRTSPLV